MIIMAEKIPQHVHCVMCGKPISMGENVCSDECKAKYQAIAKRTRYLRYMMFGLLGLLAAVLIINFATTA